MINRQNITRVVHCQRDGYDVYIGRGSKWGNPFVMGTHGTRSEVIDKYREWIESNPELMKSLDEIEGKVLGCWCKPHPCHGDVLVALIEKRIQQRRMDEIFK